MPQAKAPTLPAYTIPADLMQGIVNVLAGLPWAQVNNVMAPLMQTIDAQEQAAQEQAAKTPKAG